LNYEALLVDNEEVCLGVNADKMICVFMSCKKMQVKSQHKDMVDNKYVQSLEKVIYLGTILTNQDFIHEKI
jgi:hypothetical protein